MVFGYATSSRPKNLEILQVKPRDVGKRLDAYEDGSKVKEVFYPGKKTKAGFSGGGQKNHDKVSSLVERAIASLPICKFKFRA